MRCTSHLHLPTQRTVAMPMCSYETRCSMRTVSKLLLALPPTMDAEAVAAVAEAAAEAAAEAEADMRESIGKCSVAPGERARTPGDFFWWATEVASDE